MKLIKIEFTNYKLLENLSYDFDGSNVYLVKGGNEKGKTTFCSGILSLIEVKNNTTDPITIGKEEGEINGIFTDKNGKTYIIKFEFGLNKQDKFTLIDDSGSKTNKVTDIRNLFNYVSFTAEEFLSWSGTAEGRKKQRNIILNLLHESEKKKFLDLEDKEKVYFDERTEAKKKLDAAELTYKNSLLNKEDNEQLAKEIQVKELLTKYNKDLLKIDNTSEIKSSRERMIISVSNCNTEMQAIIEDLELDEELSRRVEYIFEELHEEISNKIKELEDSDFTKEELEEKIKKGDDILNSINRIKAKSENSVEYEKQFNIKLNEWKDLDKKVSDAKTAKLDIIKNSNLPVKDIVITEDGVYMVYKESLLPLNDKQISTSKAMRIIAKIMLYINHNTPILLMGRAESFDKDSMNEMIAFATENDCQLILDRVIDDGELVIEGIENKEQKKSRPTTKSTPEDNTLLF